MPIVSNEITQQASLAMLHDLENTITNLTNIKSSLSSKICNHVQSLASLDNDSPEYKRIEAQRQQLAAYEKRIDAQIQEFQNKKQQAEARLQKSGQEVQKGIAMAYGGGGGR